MDDEERQKKVLLGKEKLAAFKKKKLKRKKKKKSEDEIDLGSESEASSVIDMTELGSLSDVSDSSYSAEQGYRSAPVALEKAQRQLNQSHDRITQLEETLLGKEALLESLLTENEALKSQLDNKQEENMKRVTSQAELITPVFDISSAQTLENCHTKILECENAIKQRDEVISQLSENLRQTTENRDSLQADYQRQAEQLAEQVQVLQDQLKQTGNWLQQHSGGHGISAEALMEAKNELLALQQVNKQKDSQILQLQAAVQERDQTITHIVDKYNGSAANFEKMKKAYIHLQNETMVLKQEKSSTSVGKLQLEVSNLKQSYNDALQQISQLAQVKVKYEVLEVENEKLKSVNDELLKKDSGSTEVVKQLMADIESLQRGGVQRMTVESPTAKEDLQREIDRLRAELEESHGQQIVQLKEELQDQHRMEMDRAHRELTQLRSDKEQLNRQVTEWQKMYMTLSETGASGADLHLEIHALRTENSMYKDKISEMDSQLSLLLSEKEGLQKKLDLMKPSSGALSSNEDIQTLTNQCSQYKKELFELTNDIQSLHSERKTVLKELEDAHSKVQELEELQGKTKTYESMVVTLEEKLAVALRERDLYTRELESLKVKLTSIQGTIDILSADLENAEKHLESTENELVQSNKTNVELNVLCSKTQAELNDTKVKLNSTSEELTQATSQLQGANSKVIDLETNLQTAHKEMESFKSNHDRDLKVIQEQFDLQLKLELDEANGELQKTKLELETLKTTQSGASNEELVAVQQKYQSEIDRLKTEYTQYIQQVQANYEAQIKSAYEQWQTAHESQLKQVHEQYSAQVVKVQEQYTEAQKVQASELQKQHQKEIQDIKQKHDEELMKVMSLGESNVEKVKKESEKVQGSNKNSELSMEVGRIQQRHNEEVQMLQAEHSREISRLKAHCDSLAAQVAENVSSSGQGVDESEPGHQHHVYSHTKTTRIVHKKVVQSSSHVIERQSLVSEGEHHSVPNAPAAQSVANDAVLEQQRASETSLQSTPHETAEMISAGDYTSTLSEQSTPIVTGFPDADPSDLIAMLKSRVQELEERNSALEDANRSLNTEVVASSSLDTIESSPGSSTTLHEIQLKDYQLSVLEKENDKLTGRINELNALLTNQGKQPVEGEDLLDAQTMGNLAESPELVKQKAVVMTDNQNSSMTAISEAEVSMMTEASDLYVSALESPEKGNIHNIQELQAMIKGLESSKQRLTAELHAAEHNARENEGKLLSIIEDLKDKNVMMSKRASESESEAVSDLKNQLKYVQTSKASLETEIFYKDLEISKLVSEKEGLLEKESETNLGSIDKDEVDAEGVTSQKPIRSSSAESRINEPLENEEMSELKMKVDKLKAEMHVKEEEIENYKMQLEAQQADFDRLKMEMVGENFEVKRLNAEVDTLKVRPDSETAETKDTMQKETMETLRKQVKKLEEEKVNLINILDERETDIGELKAELDSQKTEIMELMKEAVEVDEERVKEALTNIRRKSIAGMSPEDVQEKALIKDDVVSEQVQEVTKQEVEQPVNASEEIIDLQWKIDKVSAEKVELEQKFEESLQRNHVLEGELESIKSEYESLKEELGQASSDLVEKEQLFQNQSENVDMCISDLNNKISKLEESEKELQEKLQTAEMELKSEQEQCILHRDRETEIQQKFEEVEKGLKESRAKLLEVQEENDLIQSQKLDLEKEVAETKQILAKVTSELESSMEEFQKQAEGLNQSQVEVSKLKSVNETLMKDKEELEEQSKRQMAEFESVQNESFLQQAKFEEVISENRSIKNELQRLENEKQEMNKIHKVQVQSMKEDHAKLVSNYEGLLQSVASEKGDIVAEFEQMREMVDEKQKLVNEMQEETALLRLANQELMQEQEQQSERLTQEDEVIQKLQSELEEMKCRVEDLKGLEEQNSEIEKGKERLLVENESLQRMVTGQGETIVDLKEEVKVLKTELEGVTDKCGVFETEAKESRVKLAQVESSQQLVDVKIRQSEEKLEMAEQQLTEGKVELERVQSSLTETEEIVKEKEIVIDALKLKVQGLCEQCDLLKSEKEKVTAENKSEMTLLHEQLQGSKQSIELFKVEIDTLQNENKDKDRQLNEVNKERHNLETNLENLWTEKEQLCGSLDLLKQESEAMNLDVSTSHEQIVSLKSANQDLETKIEELKTELDSVCNEKETLTKSMQDIVGKLNDEANALKKQLEAAEEASVSSKSDVNLLTEQLDGSAQSIELLKVEIGNLQNEKDDKEHRLKELRAQVEDLQNNTEALKASNDDLVAETAALKEENQKLNVSMQISSEEIVLLKSASSSMEERTELLKSEIKSVCSEKEEVQKSLEEKIDELNKENRTLRQELSDVNMLNATSKSDMSVVQEKLTESAQSIEELKVELEKLREEKESTQREFAEVTTEKQTLESSCFNLKSQNEEILAEVRLMKEENERTTVLLDKSGEEINVLQTHNHELKGRIEVLTAEINRVCTDKDSLSSSLNLAEQEKQELNRRLEESSAVLVETEKSKQDLSAELLSVKMENSALTAQSDAELQKLSQDLGNLQKTVSQIEMEKASLTTSGEELKQKLRSAEDEASNEISRLEREKEDLRESLKQDNAKAKQELEEMVQLKSQLQESVEHLSHEKDKLTEKFGIEEEKMTSVIAELKAEILGLRSNIEDINKQSSLQLEKLVQSSDKVSEEKVHLEGLVQSLKEECGVLNGKLSVVTKEKTDFVEEIEEMSRSKLQLEEKVSELEADMGRVKLDLSAANESNGKLQEEVASLNSLIQKQEVHEGELKELMDKITSEKTEICQELAEMNDRKVELENKIEEMRGELDKQKSELDQRGEDIGRYKGDVLELNSEKERLNVQLTQSQNAMQERDKAIQGIETRITDLEQRNQQFAEDKAKLESSYTALENRLKSTVCDKDELTKDLKTLSEQREDLEQQKVKVAGENQILRNLVNQLKKQTSDAEEQVEKLKSEGNLFKHQSEQEVSSLQLEIKELRSQADLLKSEKLEVENLLEKGETALNGFRAEKEKLSEEMKSLRLKLESLEGNAQKSKHDLEEVRKELGQSKENNQEQEQRISELLEEKVETGNKLKEFQDKLARLSTEKTEICGELSVTLKEFTNLKSDLEGLKSKLSQKSEQVTELKSEKSNIEEELSQTKASVIHLQEQLAQEVKVKEGSDKTIQQFKLELETLRSQLEQERQEKTVTEDKGRRDVENVRKDLQILQSEKEGLVKKSKEMVEELDNYKSMLESEEKEHKITKARLEEIKRVEDSLNSKIECVLQEKGELENEKKSLKKEIEVIHRQNEKIHQDFEKLKNDLNLAKKDKEFSERERSEIQESLDRLLHEHGVVTMEKEEVARVNKSLRDEVTSLTLSWKATEGERERSIEELRLLTSDKEGLSSLAEEYLKDSSRLKEELAEARDRAARATIEQDRLRSENLSLEVQRDGLQEKFNSAEREKRRYIEKNGGLEAQLRVVREEKMDAAEMSQTALKREIDELKKTHSEAMYDLQKKIKNETNLSGQLEKEKKRLQEKYLETQQECDRQRRGREEAHRDYMKISHECDVIRQEMQGKDFQCVELKTRVHQLETENLELRTRSQEDPVQRQLDRNVVKAELVANQEASRAEVKELQEEVSALQRKVTEVSEQKQLMEASIENVKYERDRLKQQVEDFERSVRDGDELDVSLIHEHEVSTLKRSLETAMTEREAMKTTFEEDLARLNSQVEEKENQRKQLEEAVEDLKHQSEEFMLRHSTPLTLSEHDSSSATDSPPKPFLSSKQHQQCAAPQFMDGFGSGIISDSVQLQTEDFHMLRNLHEIEPDRMVDRFEAEPEVIDRSETESKAMDMSGAEAAEMQQPIRILQGFGGLGPFSDSCNFDSEENLQLRLGLAEKKAENVPQGSEAEDQESVQHVIHRYENEIRELKEQFEVELKVTEFNVSETFKLQQLQMKAQVQADFETEYRTRYKEMENDFEQKMKLLQKEHNSNLVSELQKMRQEFEKTYQGKRETGTHDKSHDSEQGELSSQLTEESLMLRRKLERAEEAKISLMEQVDSHVNREADLQEELLTLTKEKDRLAGENSKLSEQLEFYTQTGTVESASEFSTEEWRVSYNTQMKNSSQGEGQMVRRKVRTSEADAANEPNLNDIGDGSLPTSQEIPPSVMSEAMHHVDGGLQLDSGDENELRNQLDALISENESLKVKLKNQSLGVDESIREEALEMQSKYQMLLQEKENLLHHLHGLGFNPSDLSLKQASIDTDCVKVTENTKPELNTGIETQGTLEEDFMDWKLKYEVVEKENQTLKSQIESANTLQRVETPSMTSSTLNVSPSYHVISSGEYRNRYSALVEQNEMLRAHLGARGLFVDRSLEGDTLDMHLQLMTLATENEQLQQHLQDYDTAHLQGVGEMMPTHGDTGDKTDCISTTHQSDTGSAASTVNWRQLYEKLCKEHEEVKQQLADVVDSLDRSKVKDGGMESVVTVDDVELQLQSAMEESVSESKQDDQREDEKNQKLTEVTSVTVTSVSAKIGVKDEDRALIKNLEEEVTSLKNELQSTKSKAKKDLTKIKAKLAASNRELEKVRNKLSSYESQENVSSTVSNTSDSSAPEDGGFVVVSREKTSVSKPEQETVISTHSEESVVTESLTQTVTVRTVQKAAVDTAHDISDFEVKYQAQVVKLAQLESENRTLLKEVAALKEDLKARILESELVKQDSQSSDAENDLRSSLASAKNDIEVLNEQLFSIQRASKDREMELEEKCSLLDSNLKESNQKLESMSAQLEKLKSKADEDQEWHEAENLNLQDQIELLINDKKNLVSQLKDMEKSNEKQQRQLQEKLGESMKEVDQLKHQVDLVNVQKSKTAEQLVNLEEQVSESEVIVNSLRLEVERHSVSEKELQNKVKELENEKSYFSDKLRNLQKQVPATGSVSTSFQTLHGGSDGRSEPFSSDLLCCEESDVHDSSMNNMHGGLLHGVGPTPGEGMLSQQPNPQSLLVSNQHSNSYTQTAMSLQETEVKTNTSETETSVLDESYRLGFHPIREDYLADDVLPTGRKQQTYSELLEECKELRLHYENIASQNSHLMLQLEEMEAELTDVKFQLSCQEDVSMGSLNRVEEVEGQSIIQAADQTDEVYCDSLEGDNKSDSSFTMSGVVNMSVTDIVGSIENDIGRVVDVQTVSPSGQMGKGQGEKTCCPEKNTRQKSIVSSTPKPQSGVKVKEVRKTKPPRVKDTQPSRLTPKAGKLTKSVSEAELSADLLKKERDRLSRENRQLKDKVNHMSKSSNELNSLRTRYDRLNKEKRDLQAKYDRDVSRKSPGAGIMRRKNDAEDLKKLKSEKVRLEKEMKELKSQMIAKSKENTELLNLIHQSGQVPYNQDITQLRIEYEILLDEKKQMCDQFETEKMALTSEIEDLQSQLEIAELERDSAVQGGLSASFVHVGENGDEEEESLKKHVVRLSQKVRDIEQEKLGIEETLERQKDDKFEAVSRLRDEKLQLQQRVTDLNSKTDVLQQQVRDLISQLKLAELEKVEIKSELEEQLSHLEQENNQNKKQLAVIQATECSSSQPVSTITSSMDHSHMTQPVSVQIPPTGAASHNWHPSHTSHSPFSVMSNYSPMSVGSGSSGMQNYCSLLEGLTFSEIVTQYEILLQEKKTICSKLDNAEEALKEFRMREAEMTQIVEERDSYRIQCELLMDEKKELSVRADSEMEMKNKIRVITEQMLELKRENQVLRIRTETLRRTLSQEPIEEECFETQEVDLQRKEILELEHKVKELAIQLEKSEQDLEVFEATAKQEAEESFVKFEAELKDKGTKLSNLNDELEDSKFRLDEMKVHLEMLQEEKDQALAKEKAYRDKLEDINKELDTLRSENAQLRLGMSDKDKQVMDTMKDLQEALDDCLTGKKALWNEIQELKRKLEVAEKTTSDSHVDKNKSEENDRMTELQEQNGLLQEEIKVLKQENVQFKQHTEQLASAVTLLTTEKNALQKDKERLEAGLGTLQKHAKEVGDQVQSINEEYTKLEEDRVVLASTNESLLCKIHEIEDNLQISNSQNDKLTSAKVDLERQIADLKANCVNLSDSSRTEKQDLEKALEKTRLGVEEWKGKCLASEKEVENLRQVLDDTLQKMEAGKILHNKERAELEVQVDNLKSEIRSMNTELKLWKDKTQTSQDQRQPEKQSLTSSYDLTVESLTEDKNNEMTKLLDQNNELKSENALLNSKVDNIVKEKVLLEEELHLLKETLSQVNANLASSELLSESLKSELGDLERDIDLVKLEKEALQKFVTEAEIRKIELEEENSTLTSNLQHFKLDYINKLEESRSLREMETGKALKEEEVKTLSGLSKENKHSVDTVDTSSPKVVLSSISRDEVDLSAVALNNNTDCKECVKCQLKIKELHSEMEKLNAVPDKDNFISGEVGGDSADVGADLILSELQEENACLFRQKTELENALMNVSADKQELEGKLKSSEDHHKKELESMQNNVGDYQSLCDTVSKTKERLEQELLRQREEYEEKLLKLRSEKLKQFVEDAERLDEFVEEIKNSERKVAELRDELRTVEEEKGLLQLKVGHLLRECKLYERHVKDLEREVCVQASQIQEATQEHKETIRMLAEMRLEQEMSKQQHKGEFSRIEGEIKRLETEMHSSNRSTPRALSVVSAPVQSHGKARAGSVLSCDEDGRVWSDCGVVGESEGERALSAKHFQMIEEINRLHRDLQEARCTNNAVSFENKQLKEALDLAEKTRQGLNKSDGGSPGMADSFVELRGQRFPSAGDTPKSSSRRSSMGSLDYNDIPVEMISLKEKTLLLQTNNHKLTKENENLRLHISKLEKLIEEYQVHIKGGNPGDFDKVLAQQIGLLKQQRDDLVKKVDELKVYSVQYVEAMDEKGKVEEALRREKDLVRQRTHEKEKIEIELLRERLALERQIREQHRLEDLIRNKEVLEKELYRQKQTLEEELVNKSVDKSESIGVEAQETSGFMTSSVIQNEHESITDNTYSNNHQTAAKSNSFVSSVSKPEPIFTNGSSHHKDRHTVHSSSSYSRRSYGSHRSRHPGGTGVSSRSGVSPRGGSRKLTLDCGCVADLDTMKMYAECPYHIAVERLRKDLNRVEGQFKSKKK